MCAECDRRERCCEARSLMAPDITPVVVTLTGLTAAASMFPGQREPGALTRFAVTRPAPSSTSDSTMDAATVRDRQREGGGSPAERGGRRS
jgi:hypothetical protein